MTNEEIIEKLRDDDHYYGKFGQQYLSNVNRWVFPYSYT